MLCPNCGNENKSTNIRCEYCSHELISESELNEETCELQEVQVSARKFGCLSNIFFLIILGPFLFICISFSVYKSSVYRFSIYGNLSYGI